MKAFYFQKQHIYLDLMHRIELDIHMDKNPLQKQKHKIAAASKK